MSKMRRTHTIGLGLAAVMTATLVGLPLRAADEVIDYEALNRIRSQGLTVENSKVMEISSYLTDVYGPRLTGSPNILKAGEWSVAKMKEWGLENVALEPWPAADASNPNNGFPRGWVNEKFYLQATAPQQFPIPGTPSAWTPGTNGLVKGEVVRVTETTEAELKAAYAGGKLKGKWVITGGAPDVQAYWTPPASRYTREELDRMESPARTNELGSTPPGGRGAPGGRAGAPPAAAGGRGGGAGAPPFNRNAFFVTEGVLGVFATAPRGHGIYTIGGGSRTADPATLLPTISIPAEQYGRIARMIEKGIAVTIEGDIKNTYTPNPALFNVVGEIRGTDKADELVMLGAHFESWHASTGATDNVAGSAAMMEAMRILKQSGVKLRRTVRIGLWTGEEQGLIGSRMYVTEQFGDRATMKTTAAHEKFAGYFNMDNGSGAIRGVYLQGNEAVAPIFEAWMKPFHNLGMTTLTIRNTGGTDHGSFDAIGLPGWQFIQDPLDYGTRSHHTNWDVYERAIAADLMKNATIIASFVYHTANRDQLLPRKPMPAAPPAGGGRGRGGLR